MKKKNVLMMALSLCLVAVIAVGGTLAYLTDSDTKLTNTFAFADNLTVTLDEEWTEDDRIENETATLNDDDSDDGYDYTNVVAGQNIHKEPTLSVTTEVDAYVFVRITESSNVDVQDYKIGAGEWTELETEDDYKVLYKTVENVTEETTADLGSIFTTVKVDNDATGTLAPITIEVGAIQMAGFDGNAAAAYAQANFQG